MKNTKYSYYFIEGYFCGFKEKFLFVFVLSSVVQHLQQIISVGKTFLQQFLIQLPSCLNLAHLFNQRLVNKEMVCGWRGT